MELWVYGGACWCIEIIGGVFIAGFIQDCFVYFYRIYWMEDIKINFDNQVMVELYCK